jgi:hypothetical protein
MKYTLGHYIDIFHQTDTLVRTLSLDLTKGAGTDVCNRGLPTC